MDLPAIFSLLFAALITLLPVLLLMGRRMAQGRGREEPAAADQEGTQRRGPGDEERASAKPALGRLRERFGAPERDATRRTREIYTRGQRPSAERDLRDAARIAGGRPVRATKPAALSHGSPAATRRPGSAELLQQRVARLSPLQRAVVYAEILGKPAALREPGRREAL